MADGTAPGAGPAEDADAMGVVATTRDDGNTYYTIRGLPGFHFILGPEESAETVMLPTLVQFFAHYLAAAIVRERGAAQARGRLRGIEEAAQVAFDRATAVQKRVASFGYSVERDAVEEQTAGELFLRIRALAGAAPQPLIDNPPEPSDALRQLLTTPAPWDAQREAAYERLREAAQDLERYALVEHIASDRVFVSRARMIAMHHALAALPPAGERQPEPRVDGEVGHNVRENILRRGERQP